MAKLQRRAILYIVCTMLGALLFKDHWLLPILGIYFIAYSPTERMTDEFAPIISLLLYSQFVSSTQYIESAICYIFIYWSIIMTLTIILPRYTLKDFDQPKDEIIDGTKRAKCGLDYYLEHKSPSDELLRQLSQRGDDIVDDLMPDLLKLMASQRAHSNKSKRDIDAVDVLLDNMDKNEKFRRFIEHVSTVPNWCKMDQLNIAQKLHQRLALPFTYVLGICTLVGGFGCPQINNVLISSRYWSNNHSLRSLKNTLNRLRETAIWLYTVMRCNEALSPFGSGWKSILRVRLFHAKVRYQLKQSHKADDVSFIAINQLHLTATLLGFQYNPLVVLKGVIGVPINNEEMEAYTLLWRYIGYILGCVEYAECVPLQSFAISRAWMAKIWDNLIHPDIDKELESTTLMLSEHVLSSIAMNLTTNPIGRMFSLNKQTIEAFFRAFLTEEYANMIKLASIHWSYELQIRVILALIRIVHIVFYQLHLNYIEVIMFGALWNAVVKYQTFEVMKKKDNYHCRFTKYCGFTKY